MITFFERTNSKVYLYTSKQLLFVFFIIEFLDAYLYDYAIEVSTALSFYYQFVKYIIIFYGCFPLSIMKYELMGHRGRFHTGAVALSLSADYGFNNDPGPLQQSSANRLSCYLLHDYFFNVCLGTLLGRWVGFFPMLFCNFLIQIE